MNEFVRNLIGLGRLRIGILFGSVLLTVAIVLWMAFGMTGQQMSVLYSGVSPEDGGRIIGKLAEQKIPYRTDAGGTAILVPSDKVDTVRMSLASQGIPSKGMPGNELLDEQSVMGLTSESQTANRQRALEGELARTIRAMQGVRDARVHIVLPVRERFARTAPTPTASVMLTLSIPGSLDRSHAATIRHVVAASVPNLRPDAVTVAESGGQVYASDDDSLSGLSSKAVEARGAYESRISKAVLGVVEPRVGTGKARVSVSAEVSLDREVVRQKTFDPNGAVPRSVQNVTTSEREENIDGNPVTVGQNLPQGRINPNGQAGSKRQSERTEETSNFEISVTERESVRDAGALTRVSVAVLIDQAVKAEADGTSTPQPRSKEEMQRLTDLVKSAVGFRQDRGDTVTVDELPFAPVAMAETREDGIVDILREHLVPITQMLVLLTIVSLLIFLVLRPIVARLTEKSDETGMPDELQALTNLPSAAADSSGEESDEEGLIDIKAVEGRVRASTVRKLSEIVDKHPEEALAIMRNWMYED